MPRPGFLFFILRTASETDMRTEASVSKNCPLRSFGAAARHDEKTATDYLPACMPPHIPTPKVEKPTEWLEAPQQEPPPASAPPFQDLSSRMNLFFPPPCRCPSFLGCTRGEPNTYRTNREGPAALTFVRQTGGGLSSHTPSPAPPTIEDLTGNRIPPRHMRTTSSRS